MDDRNRLTEQADANDYARATAARQEFIRMKMGDVPVVYLNLLPTTAILKLLLAAEWGIRRQMANDQKLIQSPWRRLGHNVSFSMFDREGMTADDEIKLGLEISIPVGMFDAPKEGQADHPEVQAARKVAMETDAHKRALARRGANDTRMAALKAWKEHNIWLNAQEVGAVDEQAESEKDQALFTAYEKAEADYKALCDPIER